MSRKSGAIDLAARVRRTSLWAVASSLFARWLKNHTRTCDYAAGVEKMSEELLGFAEPILDRLAHSTRKRQPAAIHGSRSDRDCRQAAS
jgi:hypothetical protein